MNPEVEIKIFEIDKDTLVSKLEDLWAEKVLDADMKMRYYAIDKKTRKFLRVRKEWEKTMLTYKERLFADGMQSNQEIEFEIEDAEKMVQLLWKIWLELYDEMRQKHRTSYTLPWVRFDFDKYPTIPRFMEIESTNKNTVNERIEKLWLENHPKSWLGYDDFIHNYKEFIKNISSKGSIL